MDEHEWLAKEFEGHRTRLRAVAYRMLGSLSEADDAVQETWLRLSRSDSDSVDNLAAWLTTVVGRICLNMLRSRKSRREDTLEAHGPEPVPSDEARADPENETILADSVGVALLVVLDTLDPAERLAFVLHDLFGAPFDEIAPIVDRSPAAARQLASRARRRVRQAGAAPRHGVSPERKMIDAFLAASRDGDFEALLTLLAPDVVLRADRTAIAAAAGRQAEGAPALSDEVHGPRAVADIFSGRAQAAQPALIDGAVGVVWAPGGNLRAAWTFTIVHGKVAAIDISADPEQLGRLDVTILDD
jgi:RNA polymerase sigma factor (sigma-70 family)